MTSLHRRHAVPFAARAAVTAAAALTLLTGLLAGCSKSAEPATGGTGPQVASLQTAAPQTTVAQNVDDQRPLVRLDASEAEVEALWKVWGDCILEAGGPGYEDPRAIYWKKSAKNRQIEKKCAAKQPETYEYRQKRLDLPAFKDNQREWYKCAEKAGYELSAPDENGQFALAEIGPNGDFTSPKIEACRKEAFAK